jgi:hypothetical protein
MSAHKNSHFRERLSAPKGVVRTKPAVIQEPSMMNKDYDLGDHHVHGAVGRWWLK